MIVKHSQAKDLLQLMIDASAYNDLTDPDNHGGDSQPSSSLFSPSSSSHSKKALSDDEIVSLACVFMLAGYETTSNTLGFTSYLLALNPDKQDKLCADIDAYYEKNEVLAQSFGNEYRVQL